VAKEYIIGIIGFGKAGGSLFYALHKKKIRIYIYSPKADKKLLPKRYFFPSLDQLLAKANIIFICVPDDKIEIVAAEIASSNINLKNKIFFHLSGAKDSSSLAELKNKNSFIASFHPLQTFSRIETSPKIWENTFCLLEGDRKAIKIGKEICKILSSFAFALNKKDKKIFYHAAAVFASNLLVLLIDMSQKLAKEAGINQKKYKIYFAPLIKKTLENIIKKGCKAALSGPLVREDYGIISYEIDNIDKIAPLIAKIYRFFVEYYQREMI